jgi:hypothetical protein
VSLVSSLLRRFRRKLSATEHARPACDPADLSSLERARFFSGQLITADDLTQDQIYFREKLRRHNRLLHGWGIVCGLEPEPAGGCVVAISSGYALGPTGDEIVIPEDVRIDVCKSDVVEGRTAYLAVRYAEHAVRSVATEETGSEEIRTRESFDLAVLTELPTSDGQPWVILADVTVVGGQVSVETNGHRRYAVSH